MFLKKKINLLLLTLILILIIFLSYYNAIYTSDLHHVGFIAGHIIDYLNGGILFKNIFVQYGVGQFFFFKLINYIYPINFSSIGIIISFVFCLNLIILYFILKKISSELISIFILTIIFFCHSYINFPWPDYLASFFLLLFCFCLLNFEKDKFIIYFFSGFFLFLSILFRTTYLINIFPSIFFYFILLKINNEFYSRRLVNSLIIFLFFFIVYIIYLFLNNFLIDWFYQGIGVFKDYVTRSDSPYMSWIIENFGSIFWVVIKIIKVLLRFLILLIIPHNINDFVFLIFFIINLLILISFFVKPSQKSWKYTTEILNKFKTNQNYNLFFFLSLLGFFGISQSIFYFVFYKNLNASILLFIPVAYLINCIFITVNPYKKFLKIFLIIVFLISLINIFQTFKKFYDINTNLFNSSDIEFFGKRKFLREDLEYYTFLKNNLCNKDLNVINFSFDSNAPFLCKKNRRFIHHFYYFTHLFDKNLFLKVTTGKLNDDEILITPWLYENNNLKIHSKILLPNNLKWWGSSSNSQFHYLYIKNTD